MKTFEDKVLEAWVQASENAVGTIRDWALRFAKNGVKRPPTISVAVEKAMSELKMVLVDEREKPSQRAIHACHRVDRLRHLTFAACQLAAAIALIDPTVQERALTQDAKPKSARGGDRAA